MSNLIPLVIIDDQPRIDSRVIAEQLGVEHKNTRELIYKFQSDFQEFGQLPFETEVGERVQGGGNPQKFYLLNEDQAYLLLTYTKNTDQARDLKKRLVHAFSHYRRLATHPPIPVQPQPASPYLNRQDEANIRRIIWVICRTFRHDASLSSAVWHALRQSTDCPTPHRFQVLHLPILAAELRRILELVEAYRHHQSTLKHEMIRRIVRDREPVACILDKMRQTETQWLQDEKPWCAQLETWHYQELDDLALRRTVSNRDFSEYAEPALL